VISLIDTKKQVKIADTGKQYHRGIISARGHTPRKKHSGSVSTLPLLGLGDDMQNFLNHSRQAKEILL
jgi:hypothetical protein